MATYKDGRKFDNGKAYDAVGTLITYSSNGVTIYTATRWSDGTTSCNCTGWATSKKTPKSCKHSRRVASMAGVVNETSSPVPASAGQPAFAPPPAGQAPLVRSFDYYPDADD